jgi:hypothetical protein
MKWKLLLLFVASFAVGMAFVSMSPVEHKTVFVYPTLRNKDKIRYQDKADNCYKFKAKLVRCGPGAENVPIQT